MHISYKTIYLLSLIFFGLYIFFTNISNLNFKKTFIVTENKSNGVKINKILDLPKKQDLSPKVLDSDNNLVTNLNEEIIAVKKGQTFSEILDKFLFDFNKFEIINLVNGEFV